MTSWKNSSSPAGEQPGTIPSALKPPYLKLPEKCSLVAGDDLLRISLKCDPLEADFFRSMYDAVKPGYHLNKSHWNTVALDGSVPEGLLRKMIDSSYALVVKGLTKVEREQLKGGE